MTLDICAAMTERTQAARALISRAGVEPVDLVVVSALELCVLGGPAQPLFDEIIARAWMRLGSRQQKKVIASVTEGMIGRGLLIDDTARTSFQAPKTSYPLKPELGLMLAARCRPAFIITTETEEADLRTPRFFALGDQAEPVRAIVAELPASLPSGMSGGFPNTKKLGPLGWFYRYMLLSRDTAAEVLAEWTISLPRRSGEPVLSGYLVSAYRPDIRAPAGYRLRIRGDGTTARLDGPGAGGRNQAGAEYDVEGLRAVMLDLIAWSSR